MHEAVFTSDAVVLGLLMAILGFIFWSNSSKIPFFNKVYKFVPPLLFCYILPALLTSFGLVNPEESNLYYVASRFFLPASLILLTLSIDLKEVFKLGPKALIMFFTGTVGVIIGGPLAIMAMAAISPEAVGGQGPEAIWRGMTTLAGSWIGGGANQASMFEIFKPSEGIYSTMIIVDVIVAELWMFFLLLGVGQSARIDKFFNADSSSVDTLKNKMEEFSKKIARIPSMNDMFVILGLGLAFTGLAHFLADWIAPWIETNAPHLQRFSLTSKFFWLIIMSTTFGLILSFTKAREYEGAGASRMGSVFIYFLVATIGMKMDFLEIIKHWEVVIVGVIWMMIHVALLVIVAKIIRAPYFFLAVGSKANIGGAASAPVVAAAFHPSLAPVGVLLAVLGYVLGTYGAWICGILMEGVAP
ncbi:MAG: DUF819 family protein [Flavobacteriales bacterium]|nr:DUF819 family protein [Flavobacteriales bacterium]